MTDAHARTISADPSADIRRFYQRKSASAQSTLEYILVLAAILVAVIVAARHVIQPGVDRVMRDSDGVMTSATGKLATGVH